MKRMILVLIVVIFAGFVLSIPLANNSSAKKIEKQLVEIDLPDNTEIVESLSKAGKFVGNGNGMQFFGAMLIRSEKTLDELSAYYSQKSMNMIVEEQKTQKIQCIEHGEISFKTHILDAEDYYIVYLFGDGISPFSELDIRGH